MKKALKKLGGILILFMIIGALGCDNNNKPEPSETLTPSTSTATEPTKKAESKPNLEVLDDKIETDQSTRYVVGTVKNNTSNKYKFVQLEINLYDQFGTMVESKLANTKNLEPNGSWKFKVLVTDKSAESYKIININGL